jgi:hypothetical protein
MNYNFQEQEAKRKNLIRLLTENGVLGAITLKNIKTEIGHDMMGYYCDIYLKGRGKIGYVNDDGWGGHVEPTYIDINKKITFEVFLKEKNVAKLMVENGWEFLKGKELDYHTQALCVIELKLNCIQDEKFLKKRQKIEEVGITYGTDNSYRAVKYRMPLKAILLHKGGKELLQKKVDEIKKGLKEGERILNENLEELGIKV